MSVPIPLDTLLALRAQSGSLGPVGFTVVHCRHTHRVVRMEFVEGTPSDLRWTDPLSADEAEVLLANLKASMERDGIVELGAPARH